MAWRPDGKQLAVAYDSCEFCNLEVRYYIIYYNSTKKTCSCVFILGDLLLVDVENKDIAFSKTTESKVTSLVWVQQEKPQKKDTIDSVLIKVIRIWLLFSRYQGLGNCAFMDKCIS